MTLHRIRSTFNGLDMIGTVHDGFFRCGSASGPLAPSFTDEGILKVGDVLTLAFNYDTNEYASQTGGWQCEVVRINRQSVTVNSSRTGVNRRITL